MNNDKMVQAFSAELMQAYRRGNGRIRHHEIGNLAIRLAELAADNAPSRGAQPWHITEDGVTSILTGTSKADAIAKWASKEGISAEDIHSFAVARDGWYGRTVLTPTGRPLTVYVVRASEWKEGIS